jgi:hypothetical protein
MPTTTRAETTVNIKNNDLNARLVKIDDVEEGSKAVSYVQFIDEEEKDFQIGGPLWCSIWCFMMHVVMGVSLSSFSYIPYVGESPAWLRAAVLVAALLAGALDHTRATSAPQKLDNLWKAALLVFLPGVFLFLAKLYTVLPPGESTALMALLLIIIAGPGTLYTKATGKEAPALHSEIMESLTTWAGVLLHGGADTAFAIYFVLCWKLMGSPLLMGWVQ